MISASRLWWCHGSVSCLPLPIRVAGKCASDVDPYDDYNAHLTSTAPAYAVSRATSSSSAWVGLVVVVCLFSLTAFCLVFGLLQAHSHELLCWKQQRTLYQPVPIFYHHHKGAIGVRLGRHCDRDAVMVDSENSDELYQNSPNHHKGAIAVRFGRHCDSVMVDSGNSDKLYQNSPNHREVA